MVLLVSSAFNREAGSSQHHCNQLRQRAGKRWFFPSKEVYASACWLPVNSLRYSWETRGTHLGTGRFQEPGNDSPDIDSNGGQDVLEVGARQPAIPRTTERAPSGALGNGPLDPSPLSIVLAEDGCSLPLPRGDDGLLLSLGTQGQLTPAGF